MVENSSDLCLVACLEPLEVSISYPGLVIGIEFIGLYPHGNCDVANLSIKTKIETSELLRTAVAENSSDFYPVSFRAVCGF